MRHLLDPEWKEMNTMVARWTQGPSRLSTLYLRQKRWEVLGFCIYQKLHRDLALPSYRRQVVGLEMERIAYKLWLIQELWMGFQIYRIECRWKEGFSHRKVLTSKQILVGLWGWRGGPGRQKRGSLENKRQGWCWDETWVCMRCHLSHYVHWLVDSVTRCCRKKTYFGGLKKIGNMCWAIFQKS